MIKLDESAVICDFAETYHVLNYRQLPARLAAALCVGLKADSRIKMKLNGNKVPYELELLMAAVDRLTLLVYAQTKDGQKGVNKPKLLIDQLYRESEKPQRFSSGEELMKQIEAIRKRWKDAGRN